MTNYVFGYGSLILPESRALTIGEHGQATPIIMKGVERSFSLVASQYGLTAVSLSLNPAARCTGVIFPVNDEQLMLLDKREEGYDRISMPMDFAEPLYKHPTLEGVVFAYAGQDSGAPTEECPIVQSYLDVILTGCIKEFGVDFANVFASTTNKWDHWLNDRQKPRYPRALESVDTKTIDGILERALPLAFARRM